MSWRIEELNIGNRKAKTMRSTDTGDGRKILAKVEVPLSVEDIATFALRYLDEIDDENPADTLINANKREIFNMAKTAIFKWGTQEPKTYVAENMNGHFEPVHQLVRSKFPECD